MFRILDRWEKMPEDKSREALAEVGLSDRQIDGIVAVIGMDLDGIADLAGEEKAAASNVVQALRSGLLDGPTKFDPHIIRGFDYYTSTVFEVFDTSPDNNRSLFGGGRYDNLVGLFRKEKVSGLGFGMGDVTLLNFLETHALAPKPATAPDAAVICPVEGAQAAARKVVRGLREAGLKTIQPLETRQLKKELKAMDKRGARFVVMFMEDEFARGAVLVKDLVASTQDEVALDQVTDYIAARLG